MWTRQYKKSKLRYFIFPIIAFVMFGYFAFHGINGSLGLQSSEIYRDQIATLNADLEALKTQRAELERQTKQLSDGSIERDLVDEMARHSLGLTRDNELVLLHSNN